MANVVQEPVNCSTAEEFLDALSPLGKYFNVEKLGAPWLFRGQGKDHPLIPSLFREDGKILKLTHRNIKDNSQLRWAERDVLVRFFEIADKRGLVLPDDSQELRLKLEVLKSEEGDYWLVSDFSNRTDKITDHTIALMALAQHYGIPTRLLDWTRQSFIAAFFAAEDALKIKKPEKSTLVVWSFYFPAFEKKQDKSDISTCPIRIITAPGATNANLKAQQGIFTLVSETENNRIPFDAFLENLAKTNDPTKSNLGRMIHESKLRKFTLPSTEAAALLYLLAKLDITPSLIYPGYHSIISDLQMQNLWG
jgi:hypothetical protein